MLDGLECSELPAQALLLTGGYLLILVSQEMSTPPITPAAGESIPRVFTLTS